MREETIARLRAEAADRYARRRPWRVHVHDVGPNYSYRSEERARARAVELVSSSTPAHDRYAHVTVWESSIEGDLWPLRRSVYSYSGTVRHELFERGASGWVLDYVEPLDDLH